MDAVFPVRHCQGIVLALLSILLFCGPGCVSKKVEPADIPTVSTSRNSKGVVTLSWESKLGFKYHLLIRDMNTGEWTPVAGSGVYEGTGETITVQDKQNPKKPLPWYSVRPEKIKK